MIAGGAYEEILLEAAIRGDGWSDSNPEENNGEGWKDLFSKSTHFYLNEIDMVDI